MNAAFLPLILSVLLLAAPGVAGDPPPPSRPRVALVLAGGGARGAAHLGVLKVLEEMRVPVDLVVGNSMGAAVGALHATGMSAAGIEGLMEEVDWQDIFSDRAPRTDLSYHRKRDDALYLTNRDLGWKEGGLKLPRGLLAGQKLQFLLQSSTLSAAGAPDFDALPIPFRAVATDLVSGEAVTLSGGDLAEAVRASMSVPGVFPPVEREGRLLADGLVVKNFPVDVALAWGADVVIGVNIPSPDLTAGEIDSLLAVSRRVLDLLTDQNIKPQIDLLREGDILIEPDLGDIGSADFDRMREAARMGERAARGAAPLLARLSLPPQEYARLRAGRPAPAWESSPLAEVRVEGQSLVPASTIRAEMRTRPGRPLDLDLLRSDLTRLYASGDFETVDFRLQQGASGPILLVRVKERSWGPGYLRFGLGIDDDFAGGGTYSLRAGYLRTWVGPGGGEWRLDLALGRARSAFSEFYQPLAAGSPFFLAPSVEVRADQVSLFSGDDEVALYGLASGRLSLEVGAALGRWGECRAGAWRAEAETERRVGDPSLPERETMHRGGWSFSLAADTLDRTDFPRGGRSFLLDLDVAMGQMGSDADYEKRLLRWREAFCFRGAALQAGLDLGTANGTDVPLDDQFTLGGFLSLSGLRNGQLRGPYLGLAKLVFYQRLGTLPAGVGQGLYGGVSFEGGNCWGTREEMALSELRFAGSLYLGAELGLGPAYLAWGRADNGQDSFHFTLGRSF